MDFIILWLGFIAGFFIGLFLMNRYMRNKYAPFISFYDDAKIHARAEQALDSMLKEDMNAEDIKSE